ncbi:hypothetical protein [Bifidobacterium eulemuris]|uniref:Lipoprotein n=1 Tax=Bifidobacterium eulemuris TaxID=1765219 RepID=A0A261GCK3_9BIFI|nr:hypothetical protein [Bifidobacterium eulemuris]OZG69179.1 hypothetical protein BEUL_0585 [Bifidobacterium eulemuris]QOL31308.1 hypothetical protein BE0216_01650 [Bifidobacterium eulemuris]
MHGIIAHTQRNAYRTAFKGSAALLASLWMVAALSGCGGGDGAASPAGGQTFEEEVASAERYGPLVDDWKAELESGDLSDFERGVLQRAVETGRISQDDYEQAQALYVRCMETSGYDHLVFDKLPNGLYSLSDESQTDDGYFDAVMTCSQGTTSVIEAEYRDQQDNPDRYKDRGIVAVQCLREAGVVDDSYTAAQFNSGLDRLSSSRSSGSGGNPSAAFGFPVDSDDEQTLFCISLGGLSLGGDFGSDSDE